jgi:hypothetical protein
MTRVVVQMGTVVKAKVNILGRFRRYTISKRNVKPISCVDRVGLIIILETV